MRISEPGIKIENCIDSRIASSIGVFSTTNMFELMQARTLIQCCGWQYGNRLNKDKAEATLAVLGETKRCRSIETAP